MSLKFYLMVSYHFINHFFLKDKKDNKNFHILINSMHWIKSQSDIYIKIWPRDKI